MLRFQLPHLPGEAVADIQEHIEGGSCVYEYVIRAGESRDLSQRDVKML